MNISLIVAVSTNRVIGHDNQLPWRMAADLRHFKSKTSGHHILMGKNTFHSIGRILPNRTNIVVSRSMDNAVEGYTVVRDIPSGIALAQAAQETELFVIGGAQVYAQTLPLADQVYQTTVHAHIKGDIFFPVLGKDWEVVESSFHQADEKNEYDYTFACLRRKGHK